MCVYISCGFDQKDTSTPNFTISVLMKKQKISNYQGLTTTLRYRQHFRDHIFRDLWGHKNGEKASKKGSMENKVNLKCKNTYHINQTVK